MGEVANIDLKMLYFIGIFVILLILILVSFVLTSRRTARLEQALEDAIARMQQTDQSLNKIRQSLDLLSSAQEEAEDRSQNDSTLQELQALSKKLGKLSTDYESSLIAQNELRKEFLQLKEQVEQSSFSAMPNAGATNVDHVNTVIRSNYQNDYEDASLRPNRGQSMLPPMGGRQRGLTPNTAVTHGDPMGTMSGMGSMGMGGMGNMANGRGGMGQNPLPNAMGGNGLPNGMGGYGAEEDTGMFMPPNSRDTGQVYNPSEKSGLQGLVSDGSNESLASVQSSHQSQMGQRSTTIGFTPDDEGFRSSAAQGSESAKNQEISLPSMSVVAELTVDPITGSKGQGLRKESQGLGSGVVEVDPTNHAIATKLDASKALNMEEANAKAQQMAQEQAAAAAAAAGALAQDEPLAKNKKDKGRSKLESVDPSSKLSPTEEAALAAVNSAVDETALFGAKPSESDYDELSDEQPTPQDDERFAALNNFTNLYTNARRKQLEQEQAQGNSSEMAPHRAVQDLNAVENSLSSVVTEQGSTIDFGQDMHFGNQSTDSLDKDKGTDGSRTAAVAKVVADEGKRRNQPLQEVMSPGVLQKATVVDMIYDEEYVRKQKDQKPYGINIDTLDKAHTFIDAGVSLAEISAKTGLSEDELRLLYDVDEDGKVRNSGDMFKENSALDIMHGDDGPTSAANEPESSSSKDQAGKSKRKSLSSKGAKNNSDRKESGKERLKVEPNNPSAVLDKDERKEIESIMQDTKSMLRDDDASLNDSSLSDKNRSSEKSLKRGLGVSKSFEDEHAQHKQAVEQIKDDDFEQNLDVIDQFADSLIKENRQKDNKRKQAQRDAKSSLKSGKGAKPSKESTETSHSLTTVNAALQAILKDDPAGQIEFAVHQNGQGSLGVGGSSSEPVAVMMPRDLDEPQLETQPDPLNILDDFKQVQRSKQNSKVAGYTNTGKQQDPSGEGAENLAENNAEYLKDFNADLDAALNFDDDEVTLQSPKNKAAAGAGAKAATGAKTGTGAAANSANAAKSSDPIALAQNTLATGLNKVAELANKALGTPKSNTNANNKGSGKSTLASTNRNKQRSSLAANKAGSSASTSTSTAGSTSSDSPTSRQVIKHYGKSRSSGRGIETVSGVNRETYDQTYGTEKYARNAMATPVRGGGGNEGPERITVDMALAQMGASPEKRAALGSSQTVKSSSGFSQVSSMNPGMSDVIDMAPMGLGAVDDKLPDDPAELLKQVVKGGLQSINPLNSEQMDSLNKVQDNLSQGSTPSIGAPPSDPSRLPVVPTKIKPGQHYANRKARNAYGMHR